MKYVHVCTLILAFNVRNISNRAVHSYVDHYNILLLLTDIFNETLHSDIVMRCRHSNSRARIHKGGLSTNRETSFCFEKPSFVFYKPSFVKTRRNASYDAHKPRFVDKPPLWIRAQKSEQKFRIRWKPFTLFKQFCIFPSLE